MLYSGELRYASRELIGMLVGSSGMLVGSA